MDWEQRVGRRLRLKDLHTLQVVAEVGSMAKASQRLAISQPAISKAVSDMEHTLGAPLLDRSARGGRVDRIRPRSGRTDPDHLR